METEIDLGVEAARLAKLGYAVFPCRDPRDDDSPEGKKGKKPLTPHGVTDATTDLDKIAKWWKKWPTANIGLACKNCLVLDLDDKDGKHGSDDFEAIETELGSLAPIAVAETGSGGKHLFFTRPDVEISGQTTVKWQGEPTGIDIRVGNQYIIVAPSLHESGKRYSWEKPLVSPKELTSLPKVWIDGFLPRKDAKPSSPTSVSPVTSLSSDAILARAEQYLDAVPPSIQGQNGSARLYWAVSVLLWGFGLDETVTKRTILDRFNPRCDPPWSEKEVDHKIEDANANPPKKPVGWLLDEDRKRDNRQSPDISALLEQMGIVVPETQDKRFKVWTLAELMQADLSVNFLIENVLVQGQPMIIGGPKKCLKTSIMLDMAISLASGTPFLRQLNVPKPCSVLVMSGESGLVTLRNTMARICQVANVDPTTIPLKLTETVPRINDPAHMVDLAATLDEHRPEVVMYDPAYLMLDGEKAENVMVMGVQLAKITQLCQQFNATMVLAHHFTKNVSGNYDTPPDLNDLAWSGFAEFTRQWILLKRKERFKPGSGKHKLHMAVGGSVGHSDLYELNVDEGKYPNRVWQTSLVVDAETIAERIANGTILSGAPPALSDKEWKVMDVLAAHDVGITQKTIREESSLNTKSVTEILEKLIESKYVVKTEEKGKNGRMTAHYHLVAQPER